jgi:hypothetical protein
MEGESGQNSGREVAGFWSRRRRRAGRRWCCFSSSTARTTTAAPSHSTTDDAQAQGGGVGAHLSLKAKEQRTRFYIVRRCVSMLVCWRDADDDN